MMFFEYVEKLNLNLRFICCGQLLLYHHNVIYLFLMFDVLRRCSGGLFGRFLFQLHFGGFALWRRVGSLASFRGVWGAGMTAGARRGTTAGPGDCQRHS